MVYSNGQMYKSHSLPTNEGKDILIPQLSNRKYVNAGNMLQSAFILLNSVLSSKGFNSYAGFEIKVRMVAFLNILCLKYLQKGREHFMCTICFAFRLVRAVY